MSANYKKTTLSLDNLCWLSEWGDTPNSALVALRDRVPLLDQDLAALQLQIAELQRQIKLRDTLIRQLKAGSAQSQRRRYDPALDGDYDPAIHS